MMSTHTINSKPDSNKQMKGIKEVYGQTNCGIIDLSPSTIFIMKIIDENQDNNETMRHLVEILLGSMSDITTMLC